MRDTLIGILIIISITAGWAFLKQKGLALPNSRVIVELEPEPSSHRTQPLQPLTLGEKNDKRTNRRNHFKVGHVRKSKSVHRTDQEVESVPSIYPRRKTELKAASTDGRLVPVEEYLASKRHALPVEPTTPENGMRLFVQCLEIKSGSTRKTTEAECAEISKKSAAPRTINDR